MIEQRFGKWAGTAVLAAVGAGAFAWGIHALFALLLVPIATHGESWWSYIHSANTKVWMNAFIPIIPAVVLYLAIMAVVRKRVRRNMDVMIRDAETACDKKVADMRAAAIQIVAATASHLESLKTKGPEGETPLSLAPQDSPRKT